MSERRFWNPEIETMAPAALRRLESERLVTHVDYVYRTSPFYRWVFDQAGLSPDHIKGVDDLEKVPFTEKTELSRAQRDGALIGLNQCAPFDQIVRIVGMEGGPGNLLRLCWTRRDIADHNEMGARALWAMGCRPNDLIINCAGYGLNGRGLMEHFSFETIGATVMPYGDGNSRGLMEMLTAMPRDVVFFGSPGYANLLVGLAEDEGLDLSGLGIRRGLFLGQGGRQMPADRSDLEDRFRMTARDLYLLPELGVHSAECEAAQGLHFFGGGLVHAELIDPKTEQSVDWSNGARGELVFSSLTREACPILRLRSGQIVEVFTDPCSCGRTSFRFRSAAHEA